MKAILFAVITAFVLTACNTVAGFGKDLETAGEKVQGTANKKKE